MNYHPKHPNTHLAQRVFERIEEEHLAPRPHWEFIFKNYVFWTLGVLAVLLGALAFSAALFELQNAGWKFESATHSSLFDFIVEVVPYLWAFALALFILIGFVNVRRTNHGYRYPLSLIVFAAVMSSAALGAATSFAGFGRVIEESVGEHLPLYHPVLAQQRSWWVAPAKGLLGGQVVEIQPDASFMLKDFSGQTWTVTSEDVASTGIKTIVRGGTVRVVGLPVSAASSTIHACFIFPWEPRQAGDIVTASSEEVTLTERNLSGERSDECKGIRPYRQLRQLEELGE